MSTHLFPVVNTVLLFIILVMAVWRFRFVDVSKIWDEIAALKLRLAVQEKVAPCEHCRAHHTHPGDHCDEC